MFIRNAPSEKSELKWMICHSAAIVTLVILTAGCVYAAVEVSDLGAKVFAAGWALAFATSAVLLIVGVRMRGDDDFSGTFVGGLLISVVISVCAIIAGAVIWALP
ncbi:MAG: hypothetical protein QOE22_138 [Candidatus Parcubacteria bacterium]|jgi:hypothetical protein|nr:hypothetical protein [Candidatus Parcubacteria bacterium]